MSQLDQTKTPQIVEPLIPPDLRVLKTSNIELLQSSCSAACRHCTFGQAQFRTNETLLNKKIAFANKLTTLLKSSSGTVMLSLMDPIDVWEPCIAELDSADVSVLRITPGPSVEDFRRLGDDPGKRITEIYLKWLGKDPQRFPTINIGLGAHSIEEMQSGLQLLSGLLPQIAAELNAQNIDPLKVNIYFSLSINDGFLLPNEVLRSMREWLELEAQDVDALAPEAKVVAGLLNIDRVIRKHPLDAIQGSLIGHVTGSRSIPNDVAEHESYLILSNSETQPFRCPVTLRAVKLDVENIVREDGFQKQEAFETLGMFQGGNVLISILGDNTVHLGHTPYNIKNPRLKISEGEFEKMLEAHRASILYRRLTEHLKQLSL